MPPVYRLTLSPYLQTWNTGDASLEVHLLAFPTGDPRVSLTTGLGVPSPAFAGASLVVTANLSKAVDRLPMHTTIGDRVELTLPMPAGRDAVFDALFDTFKPVGVELPYTRTAANTMRKYLPRSYRESFAFTVPKTDLAVIDDSFRCMLRCPPDRPYVPPPRRDTTWAEALGNASRLPLVMRRAGMLHTVTVPLPSPSFYRDGGWLFFTLAAGSDYFAAVGQPNFFRTFATRVPPLSVARPRPVFTPVLFPVFADETAAAAAANYDEIFPEAITFDDGFSKIVHAAQPLGMDHLDEEASEPPPVAERGIFLGWDDEDILVGQNRQMGLNADGTEPPEAPRGVAGYRIDVRELGAADWSTLSAVHTDHARVGPLDLGTFDGEQRTEVHPRRIKERIWLPAWFTAWTGGSMVVDTLEDKLLRGMPKPTPPLFEPVREDETPLRYGNRYEFRVRMADMTGGGPAPDDENFRGGEAPVARVHFKRRLPPKKLAISSHVTTSTQTTLVLDRPKIDYPAAVFANIPNAVPQLLALHAAAMATPDGVPPPETALPDRDVAFAEIRVLVRPPGFDVEDARNGWRELYTTWRAFVPGEDTLTVEGTFEDVAQLADLDLSGQLGAPGTHDGPLALPTARDLRIELCALGRDDLNYFADERSRRSLVTAVDLHARAFDETDLFRTLSPTQELRSIFLRNDPDGATPAPASVQAQNNPSATLVERLANAIDVVAAEETLVANPGERIVFGCAGLKHRLSPENGSLTFTQRSELAGMWINAVRVELDRDWTWKGTNCPTLRIRRTITQRPGGASTTTDVGSLDMLHNVSGTAINSREPRRDRTVLLFLDAFPAPLWSQRPFEFSVRYELDVRLANGEQAGKTVETVLPVTTAPSQVPEVVSAGHALSAYETNDDYSATAPRRRMLWLEFAKPPDDPRDAYFVRVIAHAPDPLLLACAEPVADPVSQPKSPLDPEQARVIVPGQGDDFAGLATMQKLIPAAGSDRHYLVPLPPGVAGGSPELFGFFSYEIRVGHDRGTPPAPFWSTAQGRFGPSLIVEGVQHPAPMLSCTTTRTQHDVVVSAPFAQPFYGGMNVLPDPPNTDIWIALYVQVHQADRATMRNVQLDLRRAQIDAHATETSGGVPRETLAQAVWTAPKLRQLLMPFGLDEHAPLSVLAIELLPEPNGKFTAPLTGDLGDVRVLRTSPLVKVQRECC